MQNSEHTLNSTTGTKHLIAGMISLMFWHASRLPMPSWEGLEGIPPPAWKCHCSKCPLMHQGERSRVGWTPGKAGWVGWSWGGDWKPFPEVLPTSEWLQKPPRPAPPWDKWESVGALQSEW